jgi:hypothetical protein
MDSNTLLHRQVHPDFVQQSEVSSQVFEASSASFKPTPKDENKLSVYNGAKFTAKAAFDHFTTQYASRGVLSVTINECSTIGLNATEDNNPFDGHAYIDFSSCLSENQKKTKAKILKKNAFARGWSYFQK